MNEIWLTVKEVSALCCIAERVVQIEASKDKYVSKYVDGKGRGGKQLRIQLESLPQEAQTRYYELNNIPIPQKFDLLDFSAKYTQKQINEAQFKAHTVRCYWRSGLSVVKFLKQYNMKENKRITERQLRDWEQKFKQSGHNPESLIDKRGGYTKDKSSIPNEVWEAFLSYILTPQNRSVSLCYDIVKDEFPDIKMPSLRTFERRFKEVPDLLKVKCSDRKDKYNVLLPSLTRDYYSIKSNEVWVMDHHLADVFVRNKRGKIVRPWLSVIMDARSRKIISCIARDADPNTIVIKQGLRIGFEKYGIPDCILADNGKDYQSHSLDADVPTSILGMLNIEKITALPYHGQSKPIERFFETLENRFGKLFYSYAGNNAKDRPDYLKKTNKELENDPNIPDIDDFISKLDIWIEEKYANTCHNGNAMERKTPNQVYAEQLVNKRTVSDKATLTLLCGEQVKRKVLNNGIRLYNRWYTPKNCELVNYFNKEVTVMFTPENVDIIYIFDEDMRFICKLRANVITGFRDTTYQDLKDVNKIRSQINKQLKELTPVRNLDSTELLAKIKIEEKQYSDLTDNVPTTEIISPQYSEAQKAFEENKIPKADDNPFSLINKAWSNNKEVV